MFQVWITNLNEFNEGIADDIHTELLITVDSLRSAITVCSEASDTYGAAEIRLPV